MDTWIEAHKFLLNLKVGEGWGGKVTVIKRTDKKIYLSDGLIISIKDNGSFKYLDSRSVTRNNKQYPIVNEVLRDIEGYLIYLIHSNHPLTQF